MESNVEDRKLIWIAEESYTEQNQNRLIQLLDFNYKIRIIDRANYNCIHTIILNGELFEIFKNIMRYDRYCLQYIQHPILSESAIIKLKQSPHYKIKSIKDLKGPDENEFYLGP